MHQLAYYTGSFDPMHSGHIETIKTAHRARPFKKLILCVGYNNVKKPHATNIELRKPIILATIKAANLPFAVEILPFDYLEASTLANRHFTSDSMRIIGSDSLMGFINEAQDNDSKWDHVLSHHHLVFVRMLEGAQLKEFRAALKAMSPAVRNKFKYQIVNVQDKTIASSDIRKDIDKAYTDGFIVKEVYDYIKEQSLYN